MRRTRHPEGENVFHGQRANYFHDEFVGEPAEKRLDRPGRDGLNRTRPAGKDGHL